MTEEAMAAGANAIKNKIKIELLERNMTQVELSNLIKENPQQLNRAIHGDMSPKSKAIREKIYKVLNIK